MNKNILDFGAIADGVTLNTVAIQSAIDGCAETGGGVVTVPTGVYKTGTIWLRDNVELHLEMGAELLASDNMDDYNALDAYPQNFSVSYEQWVGKHLIVAHEVNNCAITGFGKLNGNCHAFVTRCDSPKDKNFGWCHGMSLLRDFKKQRPGQLVCFVECTNVRVQDITILRGSGFDILSTNRGYILQSSSMCERVFKVRHTTDQTEDELNCIIELGGAVVDVFVWHRVYGRIEAPLNIFSKLQIKQFIEGVRSGKSTELMNVTGGYHYHTVCAESEEILDRIGQVLEERGYIAQEF